MEKEIFAVPFWDVSTPSFVSFDLHYFGTAEDISAFADACRNQEKECHTEFLRAYDEQQSGKTDVTINIAYRDLPFAEPVEVFGSAEEVITDIQWEMLNTWNCTYEFRADELRRRLVWLKHDGKYLRAAQYSTKGLMDKGFFDFNPIMMRLGNPVVLALEEGSQTDWFSMFYLPERIFDTESECLADMASPQFEPSEDLRSFCFEIIGDG